MAVKKNTSEQLERALSRYNLEALPKETKTALEEAVSRDDFDPDKLAEAIEREEAKRKATKADDDERCPWYVALTRVLMLLGIGGVLFAFACAVFRLGFLFLDKVTDSNIMGWIDALQQSHPAVFCIALFVGYLVTLVVFINQFVKSLTESIKGE